MLLNFNRKNSICPMKPGEIYEVVDHFKTSTETVDHLRPFPHKPRASELYIKNNEELVVIDVALVTEEVPAFGPSGNGWIWDVRLMILGREIPTFGYLRIARKSEATITTVQMQAAANIFPDKHWRLKKHGDINASPNEAGRCI